MKVYSADDGTLIIQCERFESGKEPFSLLIPTRIELIYLFIILTIFCFSGFDVLRSLSEVQSVIISYGDSHRLEIIVYSFTFILITTESINNIFFRKVFIRKEEIYRVDRSCGILPRPSYNYHQNMITPDESFVDVIDSIDIEGANNISVRVSSYYDDDIKGFPVSVETAYKVIFKFKSGEFSTIESNTLGVGSCNDNQIAFRELMTETQAAVGKIKSFLAASKNEITPSSN
jgi:hypothetical protein